MAALILRRDVEQGYLLIALVKTFTSIYSPLTLLNLPQQEL